MTDAQALYATLIALYALECVGWVPRGALALVGGLRRNQVARATTLGNARFGLQGNSQTNDPRNTQAALKINF